MSDPTRHAFGMNAEGAWECAYCGSVNDEDRNPCPRLAPSPSRDQGTSDAQIAEWERLANEATPGPWRVLENIPGPRGSLCGVAAEGHDTIENACDGERYIEVMGPLTVGRANGGREWGSGHGSHLARITWPPADECRAQALANAALAAAAREAIPALVALVRSERSQRQESEHYRRVYQEEAEAIARAEWEARVVAAESRATEAERWQVAVAEGLGFLNRAEGQSGYEVAEPSVIVAAFRTAERDRDAARKNFAWSESLRAEALLGFQREQIRAAELKRERDEARAEVEWREQATRASYPDAVPGHWKRRAEDMEARAEAAERRAEAAEARERALLDFLDAEQKGKRDHILAALAAASPSRKGDATHG